MRAVPRFHQVEWRLPQALYDELQRLQEAIVTPSRALKWESVEEMATHFLTVSVRAVHKVRQQKTESVQLVKPVAMMPRGLNK